MKILKIQVSGLKLFNSLFEIDFYAKQRVPSDKNEMVTKVFSNIYTNNVISFVGVNASGKTKSLEVISFALNLLNNEPINSIASKNILAGISEDAPATFTFFFINDNEKIAKLQTIIKPKKSNLENFKETMYLIESESYWEKTTKSIRSRSDLFDFDDSTLKRKRDKKEEYLLEDVSIIVALNKENDTPLTVIDSLDWTNINGMRIATNPPASIVKFLDPTIEYLRYSTESTHEKKEIQLKFHNKDEIILNHPLELNKYLSSGTIKGINVFFTAMLTFHVGGYFLIDELENHFNKEITSTLIRFFMDKETNKKGATLIFSTHYAELLDIFERNDNIYLIKNVDGIEATNFYDLLKRNDIKKSDLFQSGYFENTTPSYNAYIDLKHTLSQFKLPTEE